jgi:hypothetical protein
MHAEHLPLPTGDPARALRLFQAHVAPVGNSRESVRQMNLPKSNDMTHRHGATRTNIETCELPSSDCRTAPAATGRSPPSHSPPPQRHADADNGAITSGERRQPERANREERCSRHGDSAEWDVDSRWNVDKGCDVALSDDANVPEQVSARPHNEQRPVIETQHAQPLRKGSEAAAAAAAVVAEQESRGRRLDPSGQEGRDSLTAERLLPPQTAAEHRQRTAVELARPAGAASRHLDALELLSEVQWEQRNDVREAAAPTATPARSHTDTGILQCPVNGELPGSASPRKAAEDTAVAKARCTSRSGNNKRMPLTMSEKDEQAGAEPAREVDRARPRVSRLDNQVEGRDWPSQCAPLQRLCCQQIGGAFDRLASWSDVWLDST